MIEIKNLSKSYSKAGKKAVDSINLQLSGGKIYGLLGPNGAGKTTTLKLITGILQADEGDVVLQGHSIRTDDLAAKKTFAFVPDEPNAFLRLTGLEYLGFVADIYEVPAEARQTRIQELATVFELDKVLNDKISSYSHGMRQKIFLLAALLQNPPIWILDEPMTGLDPKSAFTLKEMMRNHADQGKLVLFSTHVLDVAEKVCDVIIIIDEGKILFQGSLQELRGHYAQDSSLESIFLQLTEDESAFGQRSAGPVAALAGQLGQDGQAAGRNPEDSQNQPGSADK